MRCFTNDEYKKPVAPFGVGQVFCASIAYLFFGELRDCDAALRSNDPLKRQVLRYLRSYLAGISSLLDLPYVLSAFG